MSAGVALYSAGDAGIGAEVLFNKKEDETGFMDSLLSRELAQDGASGMASDDKKAETARKITGSILIRSHAGITILNFAIPPA
jgi:hypothetical protein